jgi:subtilisin family serine protease
MPQPGKTAQSQRFILLPSLGIISDTVSPTPVAVSSFLQNLEGARTSAAPTKSLSDSKIKTKMKILDSIAENGAKLVEMSPDDVANLQTEQPGIRIVPETFFSIARVRRKLLSSPRAAAVGAAAVNLTIQVVSQANGTPVVGSNVVAFTDFANRVGAGGVTNSQGKVALALSAGQRIERLYIYAEHSFWSALQENVTLKNGMKVELTPIDLSFTDELRFFYGASDLNSGQGLKVGVIDTGCGPHKDLRIAGGQNTVQGEDPADFGDDGVGHGTHVAGMIAARGTPPNGVRGVAPGVELRAYRVFPKKVGNTEPKASNFAIAKAINVAVQDGCDLLNLSLGGGDPDAATTAAILHARQNGALAIIAAGNDDRSPVSFPASDPRAVAISALGRLGMFPDGTVEFGDIVKPFGTDKKNYIAAFSNVGPEILLTGPGVGIISSFPGDFYAVMDGTSMATPAVVGAAARLLAQQPAILAMPRNQDRSNAMLQALLKAAVSLGFTGTLQGKGILKI